ncbi:unnamed protein product, partial [Chrysoparadoxa australica]
MRSLQLIRFMLELQQHEVQSGAVVALVKDGGSESESHLKLPELLLKELKAFKARFRGRVGRHIRVEDAAGVLQAQLNIRLLNIRYVYGASPDVNLSVTQLQELWNTLNSPDERELALAFFQVCLDASTNGPMKQLAAFGPKEAVFVFCHLICGADWSVLGEKAYSCFNYCFMLHWLRETTTCINLKGVEEAVDPLAMGIETLWRITLTAQNTGVASSATKDLLSTYDSSQSSALSAIALDKSVASRGQGQGQGSQEEAEQQQPDQADPKDRPYQPQHRLAVEDFVDSIFARLGEAQQELAKDLGDRELVVVRVHRLLALL